jgi:hypothetical protein
MTISITDHALLRWLERGYGMDFTAQRQELADLVAPFVAVKARHANLGPGLYATIVNDVVTTVLPGKPPRRLEPLEGHVPERLNWKAQQRRRNHK